MIDKIITPRVIDINIAQRLVTTVKFDLVCAAAYLKSVVKYCPDTGSTYMSTALKPHSLHPNLEEHLRLSTFTVCLDGNVL